MSVSSLELVSSDAMVREEGPGLVEFGELGSGRKALGEDRDQDAASDFEDFMPEEGSSNSELKYRESFGDRPGDDDDDADGQKYEKKWVKYLLILGNPPPLTARQWKVFGLLSLAGMMTTYDDTLKSCFTFETFSSGSRSWIAARKRERRGEWTRDSY